MPDLPLSTLQNGDIVLDRYRVERGIAQGGHSLVYKGLDERLSRPVCIKAFHKLAGEKGIWDTAYEHFVQEAFALSKLAHPNTLRIYDFGHLDGRELDDLSDEERVPVQISEFMGGGTLASVVHKEGPLALPQGLRMISKLAQALAEAHRLDIVHRDIKPQNILFTGTGRNREPKLADFGIAKSVTAGNVSHQAQDTRIVVGFPLAMYSPSWAAPEQLDGAPASPAADVFSLALLAVYALSGKAICKGSNPDEAHDRRERASDRVKEVLAPLQVNPRVMRLLQESCSYRQADRPRDSGEFASVLQAAITAPPSTQQVGKRPISVSGPETMIGSPAPPQGPPPGPQGTPPVADPTNPVPKTPPAIQIDPNAIALAPSARPQRIGARTYEFVEMQTATTLHWGETRVKFSVTPTPGTPHQMTVSIKGLTTFVSKVGGRPTRAVQLTEDGFVELLTPTKQLVGRLFVSMGVHSGPKTHFQVDNTQLSLKVEDCPYAVLVDCPALHYSYFLYGLGSAGPSIGQQRQIQQ